MQRLAQTQTAVVGIPAKLGSYFRFNFVLPPPPPPRELVTHVAHVSFPILENFPRRAQSGDLESQALTTTDRTNDFQSSSIFFRVSFGVSHLNFTLKWQPGTLLPFEKSSEKRSQPSFISRKVNRITGPLSFIKIKLSTLFSMFSIWRTDPSSVKRYRAVHE